MPDTVATRLRRHAARFACLLMLGAGCTLPAQAGTTQEAVVTPPSPPPLPPDDGIIARGSGKPYVEEEKSTDLRALARKELVQLERMRRNGELENLPPERKKSIEEMLDAMSDTVATLVADDERQARMAQASWIKGPAQVVLAKGIVLNLPADVKYLAPEEVEKVRVEGDPRSSPDTSLAYLHDKAGRWSGNLVVQETGWIDPDHRSFDDPAPALERLQNTLRLNRGSLDALDFGASLARWVIPPSYDPALPGVDWAHTTGGIGGMTTVYANFLRLGRDRIVALNVGSSNKFAAVDQILTYRPQLQRVMAGLVIAPGQRHSDRTGQDKRSRSTLDDFVFGPPTQLQQQVTRKLEAIDTRRQGKLVWFGAIAFIVLVAVLLNQLRLQQKEDSGQRNTAGAANVASNPKNARNKRGKSR